MYKEWVSHQKAVGLLHRNRLALSRVKAGYLWPVGRKLWLGHTDCPKGYYLLRSQN